MANLETKGNLARLLAQENLVVEHRQTNTAAFNVEDRVLILPLWEEASETVYDLLVGHEVGHALYTPVDFLLDDIPKDIVNVVEDARIEKLIKRRYPGLARDFFEGYKELNEKDFFRIEGQDLSKYNLIDRINLHYKAGAATLVPFEDDEKRFISLIDKAETFADVKGICQALYDFVKGTTKFESGNINLEQIFGGSLTEEVKEVLKEFLDHLPSKNDSVFDKEKSESTSGDGDDGPSLGGTDYDPDSDDFKSETQEALDENIRSLVNPSSYAGHNDYVEVGKTDLDKVIAPFDKLHGYLEQWSEETGLNYFEVVDESFKEFKQSARSEVNYLVKEFEMKKSADVYSRALQSKTGVLDDRKLHSYKYTEDIFKRVTVLPEGKNHGMIFILDWSGSMGNVIESTVKQLISLCWFCKKVGIPFEVYAFTYEWHPSFIDPELDWNQGEKGLDVEGKLCVHSRFSLLNFVSSSAKSKDFEKSLLNLYRLAAANGESTNNGAYYQIPVGTSLSGTPLDDTILALHDIIPIFNKKTKSQKTTVCILTDGESAQTAYRSPGSTYRFKRYFDVNTILRDRKLGKTYRLGYWDSTSTIMLRHLNDKFPDVNLIGFRIASGTDFYAAYHTYHNTRWTPDDIKKKWSKTKCWEFNNCGYDSLYYIANSNMEASTEVDVEDGASKAEITRKFKKMLQSKKTNKKIMSSFASVVS